jgi:hypothetical protein
MTTPKQALEKSHIFGQTRLPRRGHSGVCVRLVVKPFKMGRKRVVKIRVNDAEHAALTRMGKAVGGVSALVRRHLLKHGDKEMRWEALRELARLSRNLSFIARETKHFPAGRAVEILAWLITIDRQLNWAIHRLSKTKIPC